MDAAFDLLLANRDATHGTDPTVIADGHFNRTVESRTGQGIPGLIGWDVAFLVRALVAMEWPQVGDRLGRGRHEGSPQPGREPLPAA